jgi:hypothetical protein
MPDVPSWFWVALALPWSLALGLGFVLTRWAWRRLAPRRTGRVTRPVLGVDCTTCRHFDYDAGQALLRSTEALELMTESTRPWLITGDSKPTSTAWDEFGGCHLHGDARHPSEACRHHERRRI